MTTPTCSAHNSFLAFMAGEYEGMEIPFEAGLPSFTVDFDDGSALTFVNTTDESQRVFYSKGDCGIALEWRAAQ